MKVGQVLSYIDDALPAETRKLLAVLQTSSQPAAFARIEETSGATSVRGRSRCSRQWTGSPP
jgi:predicted unusual protein kinase regulating ubiquinone biosynthesis (AarF/ABC1/UbiB family)